MILPTSSTTKYFTCMTVCASIVTRKNAFCSFGWCLSSSDCTVIRRTICSRSSTWSSKFRSSWRQLALCSLPLDRRGTSRCDTIGSSPRLTVCRQKSTFTMNTLSKSNGKRKRQRTKPIRYCSSKNRKKIGERRSSCRRRWLSLLPTAKVRSQRYNNLNSC